MLYEPPRYSQQVTRGNGQSMRAPQKSWYEGDSLEIRKIAESGIRGAVLRVIAWACIRMPPWAVPEIFLRTVGSVRQDKLSDLQTSGD